MAEPQTLVLINEKAGNANRRKINQLLKKCLPHIQVVTFSSFDQLPSLLDHRLLSGLSRIVVGGGDGTISAVGSLIYPLNIDLGILPLGTGNILSKHLRLPQKLDAAVDIALHSDKTLLYDAMNVSDRFYYLHITAGLTAKTIEKTTTKNKKYLKSLAYFVASLQSVSEFKPHQFDLVIDGRPQSIEAIEMIVSNVAEFGSNFIVLDKDITPIDGRLHVSVIPHKVIRKGLDQAIRNRRFRLERVSGIEVIGTAEQIEIAPRDNKVTFQGDGDVIGQESLKITVVKKATRFVVER